MVDGIGYAFKTLFSYDAEDPENIHRVYPLSDVYPRIFRLRSKPQEIS